MGLEARSERSGEAKEHRARGEADGAGPGFEAQRQMSRWGSGPGSGDSGVRRNADSVLFEPRHLDGWWLPVGESSFAEAQDERRLANAPLAQQHHLDLLWPLHQKALLPARQSVCARAAQVVRRLVISKQSRVRCEGRPTLNSVRYRASDAEVTALLTQR